MSAAGDVDHLADEGSTVSASRARRANGRPEEIQRGGLGVIAGPFFRSGGLPSSGTKDRLEGGLCRGSRAHRLSGWATRRCSRTCGHDIRTSDDDHRAAPAQCARRSLVQCQQ
jgi:hypothetical protein